MTKLESVPVELRDYPYWCNWRYEKKPDKDKPDKIPYHPLTAQRAKSNSSSTFAPFAIAKQALESGAGYDGVGVGLFGALAAVDIDNCIDPATGQITELARDMVDTMSTYTEVSPSGSGLRLFFTAPSFQYDKSRYYIKNSESGLEMYIAGMTNRFVTVTGNVYGGTASIVDGTAALPVLLDKYMRRKNAAGAVVADLPVAHSILTDEQVIEKASRYDKFAKLYDGEWEAAGYPSQSEADQALCNTLAFWCGRDIAQMDRIFSMSGLHRDKWEEREDYRVSTLTNAVRSCTVIYDPSSKEYRHGQALKDFEGFIGIVPENGVVSAAKPASVTLCASDVEVKPVRWLWRDVLVQGGLNSIQGIAGIGKTFMLCAVAASASAGGGVQSVTGGMERLPQGRVLYLSGDDDISTTIVPRLKSFSANLNNVHFPPNGMLPFIGSAEFAQLFECVKPSLAIVDTLQHFLPPRTEVNSANSTTVALQPLKALAEHYNCAVVIIQHINKVAASGNGGEHSVNFGIGSAAVNGLFRSVWTLGRLKGDDGKPGTTRALSPSKTNLVAGDPPSILFDLTAEHGFQWSGIDEDLTAEQLYSPSKKSAHRADTLVERTAEEIITALSEAQSLMRSEELQMRVINATGCGERTYKTARKKAGVVSVRSGDIWFSHLPKEV